MSDRKLKGEYYYKINRYEDANFRRFVKTFGAEAVVFFDYACCLIKRDKLTEISDNLIFIISDYFFVDETRVRDILNYCQENNLFPETTNTKKTNKTQTTITLTLPIEQETEPQEQIQEEVVITNQPIEEETTQPQTELPTPTYKEEDKEQINNTIEALRNETIWQEQVMMTHALSQMQMQEYLNEFKSHCILNGKETHTSLADAKKHFSNWLKFKPPKTENNETIRNIKYDNRRGVTLCPNEQKDYSTSF